MARLTVTRLDDRLTPAGWLDPTWGTGGVLHIGPGQTLAPSLVDVAPDGGVFLARNASFNTDLTNPRSPAQVTRYTPGGSPDAGFGDGGTASLGRQLTLVAMTDAPAGGLYVLGIRYLDEPGRSESVLFRLTAAGQLDPAFGRGGEVRLGTQTQHPDGSTTYDGFDTGYSTPRTRPDGSVLLVGYDGRIGTVTADGSFDPGAAVSVPKVPWLQQLPGQDVPVPVDVLPTADGGLYAISRAGTAPGAAGESSAPVRVVTKLTADGRLDESYGTGGHVVLSTTTASYTFAPAPDGSLTVGINSLADPAPGWAYYDAVGSLVGLARLAADGKLDLTYAGDGVAEVDTPAGVNLGGGWYGAVLREVPLPDGRVLLFSQSSPSPITSVGMPPPADPPLYVRVVGADGRPDPTVADSGWLAIPTGGSPALTTTTWMMAAGGAGRVAFVGSVGQSAAGEPWGTVTDVAVLGLSADTPAGATRPPGTDPGITPPVIVTGPPPAAPVPAPFPPGGCTVFPPTAPTPAIMPTPVAGDLDGDGVADRVATDGPRVSVLSGADGSALLPAFAPFEASYTGPLNAVLADVDGDGRAELVVAPDQGGGPVVAVYRADGTQLARFFGIDDPDFRGGARLAAGDVDGDGSADLVVTAGDGGGPRVAVYDGRGLAADRRKLVGDFYAFEPGQRGGAFAAVTSGRLVFGAGPGGGPRVRTVDTRGLLAAAPASIDDLPTAARLSDRFVGDPDARLGARLSMTVAEVLADPGDGTPPVPVAGVTSATLPAEGDSLALHGTPVG